MTGLGKPLRQLEIRLRWELGDRLWEELKDPTETPFGPEIKLRNHIWRQLLDKSWNDLQIRLADQLRKDTK